MGLRTLAILAGLMGAMQTGGVAAEQAIDLLGPPHAAALGRKAAVAAFDKVWEAFDREYAMFAIKPNVNWAKLRTIYRPRAAAATDQSGPRGRACRNAQPSRRPARLRAGRRRTRAGLRSPTPSECESAGHPEPDRTDHVDRARSGVGTHQRRHRLHQHLSARGCRVAAGLRRSARPNGRHEGPDLGPAFQRRRLGAAGLRRLPGDCWITAACTACRSSATGPSTPIWARSTNGPAGRPARGITRDRSLCFKVRRP